MQHKTRMYVSVGFAAVVLLLGGMTSRAAALQASEQESAQQILEATGVRGGLVVHLGCGDGRLTAALRPNDRYLVHGLDRSAENVQAARRYLRSLGVYGPVSIDRWMGDRLPYVDNLVNLVVAEDPGAVTTDEVMRVLAPGGVSYVKHDGRWTKSVKPRPDDIDEWTHFLHGPDNNAVGADRVAGEPRSIQWIAEPRFGRSHEELASISTAVTAGGRVFFIADEAPYASIRFPGEWRLVARDAFNGTLLWKREIPQWNDHLRHFRSGPVHLQRRLVASGDRVYATLGLAAPVTGLDAATGQTERVYEGTEHTEEILVHRGVLYLVVGTSENQRTGGGLHRRGEPEPTDFRYIAAVDADTGRRLWKHDFGHGDFLLPLTLAVRGGSVYCQTTAGVMRLDAESGSVVWQTPRATPARRMGFSAPTLVATDTVVLCADREPSPQKPEDAPSTDGRVAWGVHGWDEPGFSRRGPSKLRAYSANDGKELWSADCAEQYNAPADVFVVDGVAWLGTSFRGYDLQTGEPVRQLKWQGARVAMPHHRCYRNKATEKFIFTGRSGIELVSFDNGWIGNNSWVRGTCQYGVMPANGLVYAPPNACACYNKVKVLGFFAGATERDDAEDEQPAARLEKGPGYPSASDAPGSAPEAPAGAWPMYRCDNARSGCAATSVPAKLEQKWSVEIGGRLTQPIAAGGRVYVAATDAQTVYALSAADGKELWSFTAGGRIDSSPTFYRGTLLFGSADGWVYCLRADDGALAWRFQAAPKVRLVGAFDRLESIWPVHGSVLVQNDTAYVVAGRNSYLDGGLVLFRLDPRTGKALSKTGICHVDPETDRQIGREPSGGFDMEGVRSDLLSGDGESVFLKHVQFDREGRKLDKTEPHLFSVDGFLGEEWFVRSYWILGTSVGAGWGGWANAASSAPAGRILALGDDAVFGYGRTSISGGPTGHRADAYHLWRRDRKPTSAGEPQAKKPRKRGRGMAPPVWSDDKSLVVRAMALTPERLFVAGPPDLGKKTPGLLAFENPDEALAALRGRRGVLLRAVATEDGSTLAEHELPALPVFDGMSAAEGKLLLALRNGTVVCWAGR